MNKCVCPIKLGIATGITGLLLYLGGFAFISMATPETVVIFLNTLLHGVNVTRIMDFNAAFSWLGVLYSFVISGVLGFIVGLVYALCSCSKSNED